MLNSVTRKLPVVLLLPALVMLPGCETISDNPRTAGGAAIGTVAGAAIGAVIGNNTGGGNPATGAIIGGLAGGILGGAVGHYLDNRAKKFARIEDVQVEKIPERPVSNEPAARPEPEHIRIIINNTMLFEQGSSAIAPQGAYKLDEVARVLSEQPDERVIVRGYTSSEGTDANNQALSERRAGAIRNHLIGRGVNPNRITAVGMGESSPIADNNTEAGRAQNRRVEIEVFPGKRAYEETNQNSGETNSGYDREPLPSDGGYSNDRSY